jgi:mannose-6-phosphate isomerase class I
MQVTRWHDTLPRIVAPLPLPGVGDAECVELLQTPYFRLSRFDLRREAVPLRRDTSVCDILFAESGDIELRGAGDPVRLARGATCLIPAACAPISAIALQAQARLLRIQPAGAETET